MSEVSDPATSHDAGAHAHSSPPPKPSTSLLNFPKDATLQLYTKPTDGSVEPWVGGILHVSELVPGDGDHLLVCFASMTPSDWDAICHGLSVGDQLGLKPLLVATLDKTQIGCGLWKAKGLAGLHGLTNTPNRPTIFSPSLTLMRLLKIDRGTRTRNALVLIRNGHVVAKWVSGGDGGDKPHDWTTILSMVS